MAAEETKRYMEMQMDEMKATFTSEEEKETTSNKSYNEKDAEIAGMYEYAAECENDIECFEAELEIITSNETSNIADALVTEKIDQERDYKEELKTVLVAGWKHKVEVLKTHSYEQLSFIEEETFQNVLEKFSTTFPNYENDFINETKEIIVKRWETLIAIKKEHLKDEIAEIKISGLKPHYAKRIYNQYHGIVAK